MTDRRGGACRGDRNSIGNWGGAMRFIAFLTNASTVRDIFVDLGVPAVPPRIAPAAPHAFILTGAPTAFQPECPTVM